MSVSAPNVGLSSIDHIVSRNAAQVNLAVKVPGSGWQRVGRVQSFSEDITNNVQVLSEIGSQFMVELKKGITQFSFSIAKFYCHSDLFDELASGMTFGLQIQDFSPDATNENINTGINTPSGSGPLIWGNTTPVILEQFESCAFNTVSRSYNNGQVTVGQNATVVVIGQSYGDPD